MNAALFYNCNSRKIICESFDERKIKPLGHSTICGINSVSFLVKNCLTSKKFLEITTENGINSIDQPPPVTSVYL